MSDKGLTEALRNIIEKELGKFSKLLPKDILSRIEKNISPEIENIIEQGGYIKKSKYQSLEKIINDLEERINDLENN
jgi:polyhydroxyalkanoate synthesis regulator phasin